VDPRIGLNPVEKAKISCPHRELNHDHLVVQPVARRCTQTVPQFIFKFGVVVFEPNIVRLLRSSANQKALFAKGRVNPSNKVFQRILGIFTTFQPIIPILKYEQQINEYR
jgi:hypothetical protein